MIVRRVLFTALLFMMHFVSVSQDNCGLSVTMDSAVSWGNKKIFNCHTKKAAGNFRQDTGSLYTLHLSLKNTTKDSISFWMMRCS